MEPTTSLITRDFSMHPALLFHVIESQAGSLEKAILEGAMNSADAKASSIEIVILPNRVTIVDDGLGFSSGEEVDRFFSVFGTPHEEGDSIFGMFRMGRGQLFSFGVNTWRSNNFEMRVDIRARGASHDIYSDRRPQAGCKIAVDLYEPLLPSQIGRIEQTLKQWLAWFPIPTTVNGRPVSTDPKTAKWTVETDDAYFLIAGGHTMTVYNRGVFVQDYSTHRFGVAGICLSKARLDVNFARNDILSTCPIWRRMQAEFRKHADKSARSKPLDDNQRAHHAFRMMSGELEIGQAIDHNLRLLTNVLGQQTTLGALRRGPDRLTVAPAHDVLGKAVHQNGLAIVFADITVTRFGTPDLATLRQELLRIGRAEVDKRKPIRNYDLIGLIDYLEKCRVVPLSDFEYMMAGSHRGVGEADLSEGEQTILRALNAGSRSLADGLRVGVREIRFGESDVADSWTDGRIVWLNRKTLPPLRDGLPTLMQLGSILLSKYHIANDIEGHAPAIEFYQSQIEVATRSVTVGHCTVAMLESLMSAYRSKGKGPLKAFIGLQDYGPAVADTPRHAADDADDKAEAAP